MVLRESGSEEEPRAEEMVDQSVDESPERHWLAREDRLRITHGERRSSPSGKSSAHAQGQLDLRLEGIGRLPEDRLHVAMSHLIQSTARGGFPASCLRGCECTDSSRRPRLSSGGMGKERRPWAGTHRRSRRTPHRLGMTVYSSDAGKARTSTVRAKSAAIVSGREDRFSQDSNTVRTKILDVRIWKLMLGQRALQRGPVSPGLRAWSADKAYA